jgi:hypothetical protein
MIMSRTEGCGSVWDFGALGRARGLRFGHFKKADDFFDAPDVIRQTRFHGGRGSERFVVANRVQLTTDGLKVYINAISCFYK